MERMDMLRRLHGKIEELSRKEVDELLSSSEAGRFGLSVGDEPYVVPVSYWYRDGKIYFHSGEGKKIEYMKKNPKVCFEVDEVAKDGSWRSVIVYGKVVLARDPETRKKVFRKIFGLAHYEAMAGAMQGMGHPTASTESAGPYVGWIEARDMTGRKSA